MSKILHHNDDDGRCAAFLVKNLLKNPMEPINPKDFIEYNYNSDLTKRYPELYKGETVYIVDISMCPAVQEFIDYCIANGGNVIHIDHHATGIKLYEENKDHFDQYGDKYIAFMKSGISGTMLTWIYAEIFNDEDKKHPMDVKFDFDDDNLRRRCCLVNDEGTPIDKEGELIKSERLITNIPDIIRFIDDNDIWKHKIVETMPFTWGFKLTENKHPLSQIWIELFDEVSNINDHMKLMEEIINNGTIVLKYKETTDALRLASGFYCVMNGQNVACVNAVEGNSSIFQDIYNESPAVCKFSFDGEKWWYTIYSRDDVGADCASIVEWLSKELPQCEPLSHGGHLHAAGATFTKNIFDYLEINKAEYQQKRKEIRINKEVAVEEARIKAEEERLRKEAEKAAMLRAKIEKQLEEEEDYGF